MDDNDKERKQLGEVIATSYSSFTVESYALNSTPPLGGLVVADSVLGVVCNAHTEGLGPISAKGSAEDEDGSVRLSRLINGLEIGRRYHQADRLMVLATAARSESTATRAPTRPGH